MPVLPEVGSMSVSPSRSQPSRSASSTIRTPIRSFTLPPGLRNSHLATVQSKEGFFKKGTRLTLTMQTLTRQTRHKTIYEKTSAVQISHLIPSELVTREHLTSGVFPTTSKIESTIFLRGTLQTIQYSFTYSSIRVNI